MRVGIVPVLVLAAGLSASDALAELTVEQAQHGFAADQGGLKPGDILVGWQRAAAPPANPLPASGDFSRPSDILALEQEEAPRATLEVAVLRGNERLSLVIPHGLWRLAVRPLLEERDLRTYLEGQVEASGAGQGFSILQGLARAWLESGDRTKASWLFYTLARAAVEKRDWSTADAAFVEARDVAREDDDHVTAGFALTFLGRSLETRGQLEAAQSRHEEALAEYRAAGRSELLDAWGLAQLARVAFDRGNLDDAEAYDEKTLSIREHLAPGSTDVAGSLLELGLVANQRGDLLAAEEYDRRALGLLEPLSPPSADLTVALNNLAELATSRGDVAAAEEYLLRAKDLLEVIGPGSVTYGLALSNLGAIAADRGDFEAAERYERRALDIQEKRTPGGHWVARTLRNLGDLSVKRGDLVSAAEEYRRSVEIFERWAPGAWDVAASLLRLGDVMEKRGDTAAAEADLRRAHSMVLTLGLKGLHLSASLTALGGLARSRGSLEEAEDDFQQALAIRQDLAPGSAEEAESLHDLATVAALRGSKERELEFDMRALAALEQQRSRLGGTDDAQSRFGARYARYYREAIDRLIDAGRPEEAFHVLERFRARSFLSLLAERDLVFSSDVPAELDRQRRMANVAYDRALAELMEAKGATREATRRALSDIRSRQAEIQGQIRAASPRLATLQDPVPLDLDATRRALDPGILLLSYAIGDKRSYLFAVGPGPQDFRVVTLATGREDLGEEVRLFRQLLQHEGRIRQGALALSSRTLGDLLLRPVAEAIGRATRLLIVPDGPLHLVPFAALADPSAAAPQRYLIEAKPVSVVASATVFAELRRSRRDHGPLRLVAFGAPDYGTARAPGVTSGRPARSNVERGLDLVDLPAARSEVRGIAALFPGAKVYLGEAATEEQAKSVGKDATLVHFACHALTDEGSPLSSALVLSQPHAAGSERENGLLQAWEIFEQMRLDADLVTLSACRTALGKEVSGEGLLGLTRAFQYAGARSVLASLWTVSDDSTAQLMTRFYSYLAQGRSKDDALRAAQVDMLHLSGSSHPFRWAPFELVGDWR